MNNIIEYIKQQYQPLSIIVYGSHADGSRTPDSDFDALVISQDHEEFHDISFLNGTQLDVFVYPASYFKNEFDCGEFIQLHDGDILMDTNEIGLSLKQKVLSYIAALPHKSDEDLRNQIAWCKKMLVRTKRGDAEGMFRWHWLLVDSLEIFCDTVKQRYWGPKKTLRWMEKAYPEGFLYYTSALTEQKAEYLERWISYLERFV